MGCITIFISLISLFTVFYGNVLIDKFNIEIRFPKLGKLIILRRKFQMYYSLLDFFILFSIIIIMFILNIMFI